MLQITPENTIVFDSFEAILSALLAFVLIWVFYKSRPLWKRVDLILLLGALCSLALAFFLCSSLNFYEFYYQERLLQQDPENVTCGFFFMAALLLGAAFNPPRSLRSAWAFLFAAGAALGLVHLIAHLMDRGQTHLALHSLGISAVFVLFIIALQRGDREWKTRFLLLGVLLGFSASFFLLFLLESQPNHASAPFLWIGRHLALLGSLIALAYVIELSTQDLFVRFFIRLNLTFILLAGFIIVVVAGVQRREHVAFATREAEDLMEYLRDHVPYFSDQGQEERQALNNPEIIQRIVSAFGNISDLKSVAIRLNLLQLNMTIDSEGLIETVLQEGPSPPKVPGFEPAINGNILRLSVPIYSHDQIVGWVELNESLATMNKGIAHQIMIIFSAFTVTVILSGILIGIIVTQADSTIRKQYRELEETHDQLQQAAKLAALGEMAGGVAHEINNPLGVILGRSDYLSRLAKLRKADEFLEDLEAIEHNAARAGKIVSDLLDFARPHPLNRRQHDLNSLLTQTIELMEPRVTTRDLTLRKELASVPPVEIDWDRMQQVFVNLINNSIDACQEGGTIRLRTHINSSRSQVEVTVEDNGVGIPPEHLKKVFDPFFTSKQQGTGLGLSVSYSIVRDHGGQISVESRVGQGTRFTVKLPMAEGERSS
ncbi:ATP-binding protein [Acidobacteria bacterium AH-259-D05]|nr:ATP-binding protein [Acidobacteria bacterium AH-259-D05]